MLGMLVILVFSSTVLTDSSSATFHAPPCSEPHDDADDTFYLNETTPDEPEETEDIPWGWELNRTYYFSEKPHAIKGTNVEIPKFWMESNKTPGLQMERFNCMRDDGSQAQISGDTPMDRWVGV